MWILTILLLKAPVLCIYRPVRKLALKSKIDEMSFDIGWQLEESCGKKRDFILFIVTLKKYLDGQQMGVFTNAFWNMHTKLGQTMRFQDLIFLWFNLTVGPACLEPILIVKRQLKFFKRICNKTWNIFHLLVDLIKLTLTPQKWFHALQSASLSFAAASYRPRKHPENTKCKIEITKWK